MVLTLEKGKNKMNKKNLNINELSTINGGSIISKIWRAYGTGIGMRAWSNTALTQSRLKHLRKK